MSKDMMRLAKMTVANLEPGTINPTDAQIMEAMKKAVEKSCEMGRQLKESPAKLEAFARIMSGLIWDAVHA